MKSFLSAWQFMTVFRISFSGGDSESEGAARAFRSAPAWFPLVGLILGAGAAGAEIALRPVFPVSVRSALEIVLLLAFTGCLHMDGLADTADGFLSSRPRERILEIMRDSRSGAMAIIVVASTLLLKWSALSALKDHRLGVLLLAPVLGRTAILLLMGSLPYARPEGGLATAFVASGLIRWLGGIGLAGGLGAILWGYQGLASPLILILGTQVAGWSFLLLCKKKIGGYTGDTLGAVCELAETVAFLLAVSAQSLGRAGSWS